MVFLNNVPKDPDLCFMPYDSSFKPSIYIYALPENINSKSQHIQVPKNPTHVGKVTGRHPVTRFFFVFSYL